LALIGVGVAASPSLWFNSPRTKGTVIRLEPEVELVSHGSPQAGDMPWFEEVVVSYPVVEYRAGDRTYTYRPRLAFRSYQVGEKVPVVYRASKPGVARIDTFAGRWVVPLLLGGVQLVLGVVIVVGATLSRRLVRQLETTLTGGGRGVQAPDQTVASAAEPPSAAGAARDGSPGRG
jgi:hypothetical protein